jgi:hypothetical protein
MINEREYFIELYRLEYDDRLRYRIHSGTIGRTTRGMIKILGPVLAHTQQEAIAVALITPPEERYA